MLEKIFKNRLQFLAVIHDQYRLYFNFIGRLKYFQLLNVQVMI